MRWSFSGLKDFEQCGRKYHEVKVLRHYPKLDGEANLYGGRLHKVAENYILHGVPLEPEFAFMQKPLDAVVAMPGTKLCEYEMALREDLSPCAYDDPEAWVRGIADVVVIAPAGDTARCFDWKSGKDKYPDTDQLLLMALMIFQHFPTVQRVSGGLLFVLRGTVAKHRIQRAQAERSWWRWRERVARLDSAHATGVWNPKKSGLCKAWCPVKSCEFNGA